MAILTDPIKVHKGGKGEDQQGVTTLRKETARDPPKRPVCEVVSMYSVGIPAKRASAEQVLALSSNDMDARIPTARPYNSEQKNTPQAVPWLQRYIVVFRSNPEHESAHHTSYFEEHCATFVQ